MNNKVIEVLSFQKDSESGARYSYNIEEISKYLNNLSDTKLFFVFVFGSLETGKTHLIQKLNGIEIEDKIGDSYLLKTVGADFYGPISLKELCKRFKIKKTKDDKDYKIVFIDTQGFGEEDEMMNFEENFDEILLPLAGISHVFVSKSNEKNELETYNKLYNKLKEVGINKEYKIINLIEDLSGMEEEEEPLNDDANDKSVIFLDGNIASDDVDDEEETDNKFNQNLNNIVDNLAKLLQTSKEQAFPNGPNAFNKFIEIGRKQGNNKEFKFNNDGNLQNDCDDKSIPQTKNEGSDDIMNDSGNNSNFVEEESKKQEFPNGFDVPNELVESGRKQENNKEIKAINIQDKSEEKKTFKEFKHRVDDILQNVRDNKSIIHFPHEEFNDLMNDYENNSYFIAEKSKYERIKKDKEEKIFSVLLNRQKEDLISKIFEKSKEVVSNMENNSEEQLNVNELNNTLDDYLAEIIQSYCYKDLIENDADTAIAAIKNFWTVFKNEKENANKNEREFSQKVLTTDYKEQLKKTILGQNEIIFIAHESEEKYIKDLINKNTMIIFEEMFEKTKNSAIYKCISILFNADSKQIDNNPKDEIHYVNQIPKCVEEIPKEFFKDCKCIEEIKISENVNKICSSAFEGCASLKVIKIPEMVKKINDNTFLGCKSLTSITLSDNIKEIGSSAFKDCTSLSEIKIPNLLTKIGKNAFEGCSSLTNITIPNSITKILDNTFSGCSSLKSINFSDRITEIGKDAFSKCESLTDIIIPNGVTKILENTFLGCSSLKNIVIPSKVTEIGSFAFSECSSLQNVNILGGVTKICSFAFTGCTSLLGFTIPNTVTIIGENSFEGCSSLKRINIPDGIKEIPSNAFAGCSSITDVEISGKVNEIYECAFSGCSSLTKINIPKEITKIREKVFEGCSSLKNIYIPDNILEIEEEAFSKCNELSEVRLPDALKNIGKNAFLDCSSLSDLIYY